MGPVYDLDYIPFSRISNGYVQRTTKNTQKQWLMPGGSPHLGYIFTWKNRLRVREPTGRGHGFWLFTDRRVIEPLANLMLTYLMIGPMDTMCHMVC